MSGKVNRPRSRKQLSKADLKAYESRKAERRESSMDTEPVRIQPETAHVSHEHSFAITRNEEYRTIRADLIRLLIIVAVLLVMLAVLTIFLR